MAASYWFKVYTEVLDDAMVCSYTPEEFEGFVKLMAIAKRIQKDPLKPDGKLPNLDGICFHSRKSKEFWERVIPGLLTKIDPGDPESQPFLIEVDGLLVIRKFYVRQKPVDAAERSRQHRQKSMNEQMRTGNETETEAQRFVMESKRVDGDKEVDKEKDVDVENSDIGDLSPSSVETDSLLLEFREMSGLEMPQSAEGVGEWILALNTIIRMGATSNTMRQACKELTAKKYVITSPKSLITPCKLILAAGLREHKNVDTEWQDAIRH